MNKLLLLFLILIIGISLPFVYNKITSIKENYDNYTLDLAQGDFPKAVDSRMLTFYPSTGRLGISNEESQKMWWHYPIFKVGSYDQITNNLRYFNNPDVGNCMPGSMCGALYKEKQEASNYIKPLPPVSECPGARINYYRTDDNLLPYRNKANILY